MTKKATTRKPVAKATSKKPATKKTTTKPTVKKQPVPKKTATKKTAKKPAKKATSRLTWRSQQAGDMRQAVMKLKVSERKIRLHSVACCRIVSEDITNPDSLALIDLIERCADDPTVATLMPALRQKLSRGADFGSTGSLSGVRYWYHRWSAWASAEPHPKAPVWGFSYLPKFRDILTEILGPRGLKVEFDPQWRTETATILASTMYDSRDFSAMPILADALQDAGCDNEEILNHCRDTKQKHVRGCWVIDLVLGQS